jgi:hypothetical protein
MQLWNFDIEVLGKRLSHSTPMLVASSLDAGPGMKMPNLVLALFIFFS